MKGKLVISSILLITAITAFIIVNMLYTSFGEVISEERRHMIDEQDEEVLHIKSITLEKINYDNGDSFLESIATIQNAERIEDLLTSSSTMTLRRSVGHLNENIRYLIHIHLSMNTISIAMTNRSMNINGLKYVISGKNSLIEFLMDNPQIRWKKVSFETNPASDNFIYGV